MKLFYTQSLTIVSSGTTYRAFTLRPQNTTKQLSHFIKWRKLRVSLKGLHKIFWKNTIEEHNNNL